MSESSFLKFLLALIPPIHEVVIPRPIQPPPPPPRIWPIILPATSEKPRLLVLFPLAMMLIWLLSVKRPIIAAPSYFMSPPPTSGLPAPPPTLPNHPFIIPALIPKSSTVSSSPSSMPVNCACSDFLSTTLSLSTIFAGIFLVARLGSSRKNSFPSIIILVMVLPFAVMLPSESTSTPGSFLISSSSISVSEILNDDALYSMVSFLITIWFALPVTITASSIWLSSDTRSSPYSLAPFFMSNVKCFPL